LSISTPVTRVDLPTLVSGSRGTGWWGILLLLVIEGTVFSALIASYFYYYSGAPEWPLGGFDPPKLLLPTINAFILWTSVVPAYLADRAVRQGEIGHFRVLRFGATLLLVAFLVIKAVEFSGVDYMWDSNAYGSIIWTITGLHVAHVIAVLLKTASTQALAFRGFWDEYRHLTVQTTTLYWFFVAGIWVPLFATLYLFPNFFA